MFMKNAFGQAWKRCHSLLTASGCTRVLHRHPYARVPLVLVSGVGRSGITVLRNSLGAHDLIDPTGSENNVINDVLQAAYDNCTKPSRKSAMRTSQHDYDRNFQNLLLNLLWPPPRRRRPRVLLAYSAIRTSWAIYLWQVFPEARIVYIVRNGIEVVASRMQYDSFKRFEFQQQCERWTLSYEVARWGEGFEEFKVVRHESLLDATRAEVVFTDLFEWIGLPPDRRCLETLNSQRFHPTSYPGESEQSRQNLAERKERWRYWTDEQRAIFVEECAEAMDYFGYPIPWGKRASV